MKQLVLCAVGLFMVVSAASAKDTHLPGKTSLMSVKDKHLEEKVDLGFELIKAGEYRQAEKAFRSVLTQDSENADAHAGLGVCYWNLGYHEVMTDLELVDKSVTHSKKAISLGADYPEVHYTLGLSYLAFQEEDAALKEYHILKNDDNELAEQLLSVIDEFKRTATFIHVSTAGDTWVPPEEECGPGEVYKTGFGCTKEGTSEPQVKPSEKTETKMTGEEDKGLRKRERRQMRRKYMRSGIRGSGIRIR